MDGSTTDIGRSTAEIAEAAEHWADTTYDFPGGSPFHPDPI